MKLPFFSSKGSSSNDTYFGLFLKEHKGIGYIIVGERNKFEIRAQHEFTFSNGWENLTEDVDEVLFKLENETKLRIEKTIFFLFSHLIDDKTKEIKRPFLQKIKDLTKNLEIKPVGYIECYEAVASFIQEREGAPLTSILVELDDTNVDIFIYKGGHKVHNYVIARTDNIIEDLHSVFDTLGKNTLLPNRLILYNSSDLIEESTKIISHRWSSDLFVQLPRVEILKEQDILKGLIRVFEQQTYSDTSMTQAVPEPAHEQKAEVMGFMIGKDVGESEAPSLREEFIIQERQSGVSQKPENKLLVFFQSLKFPVFKWEKEMAGKYLIAAGGVLILLALMFGFEYFVHKAQVNVVFSSSPIEKKITADALIDENQKGAITIHVATSSVDMKDVKITTGKRDIGEKAQGEVTLYNFDDKEKVFEKGTIIQVDNLQFSLNNEVKAPASTLASDASAKLPGKAKGEVTAVEIGTESNIDKGKRFKIADLSTSEYFAMNDNGFTGGTRKSIKTVSKKDIEDLESSLLEKAKDQQKEKILKTKDTRVTLIDSLMDFELSNVKFSKELGEEGDNVSLQAKVVAKYYYFENSAVNNMLKEEINNDIPQGYILEDKNLSYKIENVKQTKNDITVTLRLQAKATKKINPADIQPKLRLKQVGDVENIMESEFGAVSTRIEIVPALPLIGNMLPAFDKNILLRVDTQ